MENSTRGEDSLSSSSSDQAANCKGWEPFLPNRPLRVLFVEDDISTRQVVCALLSKCGYEVSCAMDGSKAWELLEQSKQTFDLVLADAMMPVLSGTDLLAKIMSTEAHRDIPVIMMSAHDSLDMVFKCLLKGAKDFLVKPLRKNELRNLWQHVWRRNHASGGCGSQGDSHRKKRKASRNLSSGDVSTGNFSLNSAIDDQNTHEDKRTAQCPGVCQSDFKSKTLCPKLEGDQVVGGKYKDAFSDQGTAQSDGLLATSQQRATFPTLETREASGRSTKAFDFFGTTTTEPVLEHSSSKENHAKETVNLSQNCQASPALELTLNRVSSNGDAGGDSACKQGVRQSNCSAFSKYTSNATFTQPSCIVRSASLPADQGTYGCGPNGNTRPSIEGPRTNLEICGKANDRTTKPGNCNSATLHFPKATHFQHGRQFGNAPLSGISSCCDENSRQVQENSLSNFRSPSLNSSTANSRHLACKETTLVGSDQLSRVNLQKEAHATGSLAGSMWCSTGLDKEDFSSSTTKLGQLSSCTNADCEATKTDNYGLYDHSDRRSNADGFANAETDASLHELPSYTMVSGRGSNDGSDRGSNQLEEHLTGRSAAQDRHSLGGWQMNESGRMDMDSCGMHAFDEYNALDQRPSVFDYRSSFREAALHKFRQKRKMRCFEKKVRYQSRKKLAEQRPRVKGQFVRRAVYDTATQATTTT